jgi:hypothetical protein
MGSFIYIGLYSTNMRPLRGQTSKTNRGKSCFIIRLNPDSALIPVNPGSATHQLFRALNAGIGDFLAAEQARNLNNFLVLIQSPDFRKG